MPTGRGHLLREDEGTVTGVEQDVVEFTEEELADRHTT